MSAMRRNSAPAIVTVRGDAAVTPFVFNTTPSLVFESGAARRFGSIAGRKLGARVLLVTDPGLRRLGLCDPAIASLEAEGAAVTIFDQVEADPSRATLMKAVEAGVAARVTGVAGLAADHRSTSPSWRRC
jgi:alcohol dehydrogenase class IV